jgi:hypothetical protein
MRRIPQIKTLRPPSYTSTILFRPKSPRPLVNHYLNVVIHYRATRVILHVFLDLRLLRDHVHTFLVHQIADENARLFSV